MSDYSARSQELAKQLREKALRNLDRSAKSGQYVAKPAAGRNPATTIVEKRGRGQDSGTK
jgi:hypothetical protein